MTTIVPGRRRARHTRRLLPLFAAFALVTAATHAGAATRRAHAHASPAKHAVAVADSASAPANNAAPVKAAAPAVPETREPLAAKLELVKALYDAHAAVFVDARTAEEYAAGHVAGAVNLPFDDVFQHPERAKQLDDHGGPIVTYCDGGDCTLSKDLAFSLIEAGHKKVLYSSDGFPGWKNAGYAVHTGAAP